MNILGVITKKIKSVTITTVKTQQSAYLKQRNSMNPTHSGLERCQIIEYSRLSHGTYTELSSYS